MSDNDKESWEFDQMISILFWNLAKNAESIPFVGRMAGTYSIDVFCLAECPMEVNKIVTTLNEKEIGEYRLADNNIEAKVRVVTRLPSSLFLPRFINRNRDLTIWKLADLEPGTTRLQVAAVHLPAKVGGARPSDQQAHAESVAREIAEHEDNETCKDTIVIGDLNMNPYEDGMVIVSGFHATMTKRIASRSERTWRGEQFRRFYNPMWGLFGDRTPGPPGTHYWDSSVSSNHHWHIFDQVLLRPSLMDKLRRIEILDSDGWKSLVDKNEVATKGHLSDHLPILIEIDV